MKALGSQLLVEMYACDARILDDVDAIESAMREAALASGATIVHEKFHRFSPHGVSGVVVIAESHLAIHTWPEHRYAAVDLFTCGSTVDPNACVETLRECFRAARWSATSIVRGHPEGLRILPSE